MRSHNEPIPDGKLGQFHEILCACGGRYLSNPIESPDTYGRWRVSFEYDDMQRYCEHERRWRRITEDVREVRRDQAWRRLFRRFAMFFRRALHNFRVDSRIAA